MQRNLIILGAITNMSKVSSLGVFFDNFCNFGHGIHHKEETQDTKSW